MAASPHVLVQDGSGPFINPDNTGIPSYPSGVNVTPGNTISIKLASADSVGKWNLKVIGTDEETAPPTLAGVDPTTGVVSTPSTVVTFTVPAGVAGRAYIFQSMVNNGGPAYTTTFGIYTLTSGLFRVGAVGERFENDPVFGWTRTLNQFIKRGGGGSPGFQGFQGFQGRQGWQGFQGFQGRQGWQGNQGNLGWQGNQGRQGSGGGSGVNLSNTVFVDKSTTAPSPDGSISQPYPTLAAGIAALPTGGTLCIVPNDYTSEGPLTLSGSVSYSLVNFSGLQIAPHTVGFNYSPVILPTLSGDSSKYIQGCACSGDVTSNTGTLTFVSSGLDGKATAANGLDFSNSLLDRSPGSGYTLTITGSGTLTMDGCVVNAGGNFASLPSGASPDHSITNTIFGSPGNHNVVFTSPSGIVLMDRFSACQWHARAGTVTDGQVITPCPTPSITAEVYVAAQWGSDTTGDGTEGNPYATILYALSTITDASLVKQYVIHVSAGTYSDPLALKPWVMIQGISWDVVVITGNLSLDASFADPAVDPVAFISGCDIDSLNQMDFVTTTSSTGAVVYSSCRFDALTTFTMGGSNATWAVDCCLTADITQIGGFSNWLNCNGIQTGVTLTVQANGTTSANSQWNGGSWFGDVIADQNSSAADCIINLIGCDMSRGYMRLIATSTHCPSILSAFGGTSENVGLQGGAAKALSPQMRISYEFTNIAPNPTAIAATGTTTISLAYPVALFGATLIESMHMTATLSGSNWGTFIGPHNCSVTVTFRTNGGVPTCDVNIYNPGGSFNIVDQINLFTHGYLPSTLT
jgi:hypothetical protein